MKFCSTFPQPEPGVLIDRLMKYWITFHQTKLLFSVYRPTYGSSFDLDPDKQGPRLRSPLGDLDPGPYGPRSMNPF